MRIGHWPDWVPASATAAAVFGLRHPLAPARKECRMEQRYRANFARSRLSFPFIRAATRIRLFATTLEQNSGAELVDPSSRWLIQDLGELRQKLHYAGYFGADARSSLAAFIAAAHRYNQAIERHFQAMDAGVAEASAARTVSYLKLKLRACEACRRATAAEQAIFDS